MANESDGGGAGPQAPHFALPEWLHSFLVGLDFQILTWHLDIGSYILAPIQWVLDRINDAFEWIAQLVAWWEEFRQEVLDFVNLVPVWIGEVWNWITNLGQMIGQWISDWWDGIYDTVKEWVLSRIDEAKELITDLTTRVETIIIRVEDFFTVTLPQLARSIDVQDWITDRLAPFREMFNFFEAFKTDIVAFFSDPLQWIYDKLEEFFERFW